MIRFKNVHKTFGTGDNQVCAAQGIDLEIPVGQLCGIMGPSGSGKSTLLHIAAGLVDADKGSVSIGARDVSRMTAEELTLMRRREVGVVFQFFNLLPYLDARENVELPLLLDAINTDERRNRATKALEMVGLLHRATHRPPQMSGGEMQRVAIARALVISPRLVLADEPTGNLDSAAGRQIISLLRDINDSTGVTMLVVTHDPVWAANCDRVIRLVDGLVSEDTYLKPRDNGDSKPNERGAVAETSGKNGGKAAAVLQ